MINKPTVKRHPLIMMGTPKTIPIKKPTVTPPVTYASVLEFLKSCIPTEDNYYELQEEQRQIIEKLFAKLDNKVSLKYLAEKITTSRFKSFKMAMKHFDRLVTSYLEGTTEYTDIGTYVDNIPNTAGEHWYEEFNDLRKYFFQGIKTDMPKGHCFKQVVDILANAETFKNDPDFPDGGYVQDIETVKILNRYIIDLSELVWPDDAKSLKLLFGG